MQRPIFQGNYIIKRAEEAKNSNCYAFRYIGIQQLFY
jgi:hypothetical protein